MENFGGRSAKIALKSKVVDLAQPDY